MKPAQKLLVRRLDLAVPALKVSQLTIYKRPSTVGFHNALSNLITDS